jgi:hypothetical protein
MTDENELRRLKDAEHRARFALRRAERNLTADERDAGRALDAFTEDLAEVEQTVAAELRKEHWGRDPERPVAWRKKLP